jgi:hypothetical protein
MLPVGKSGSTGDRKSETATQLYRQALLFVRVLSRDKLDWPQYALTLHRLRNHPVLYRSTPDVSLFNIPQPAQFDTRHVDMLNSLVYSGNFTTTSRSNRGLICGLRNVGYRPTSCSGGESPATLRRRTASTPGQSKWHFRWIKWYWCRLFSEYFGLFPRQYHSTNVPYSFIHSITCNQSHKNVSK